MNRRAVVPRSLTLLALAAVLEACASAPRNVIQMDVGRASRPDVLDKVPRILDQHGYEVQERHDTGTRIQYVTSWITRAPLDDEMVRGADECRTRLTLEARQGAGEVFSLTIKAESMMRGETLEGGWVNLEPTPMFREHVRSLSEALALEVDMGVRTR
jgi:hypothetical protein